MANRKKVVEETINENVDKKEIEIAASVEKKPDKDNISVTELTLSDVAKIVNSVVDSVFINKNGRTEFAAEYYEVLLAYFEVGAFYPESDIFSGGVELFFPDYISGKYNKELNELKNNRYALYIENAIKQKVEARMKQIENPLFESLTNLLDIATVLAKKYVNDMDKIGTSDIQNFITGFGNFAKNVNIETMTDAVIKMHQNELLKDKKNTVEAEIKLPAKKRSGQNKKSV